VHNPPDKKNAWEGKRDEASSMYSPAVQALRLAKQGNQ
jgi:hypothetical protein